MDTPDSRKTPIPGVDRRTFIKVGGAAGIAAAAGGLEGVLAARRAPAYAQGMELHWVRWNDFIPECDTLLKTQQVPEASKALGAKITLETIGFHELRPHPPPPPPAALLPGRGGAVFFCFVPTPPPPPPRPRGRGGGGGAGGR